MRFSDGGPPDRVQSTPLDALPAAAAVAHRCARCGASCQGLRVRPDPDERDALARAAAQLGVDQPFSRGFLRQNWGRCVFFADGCRLHRELGAHTKPRVCRQFPFVFRTDTTGVRHAAIDPACFHPARSSDPEAQTASSVSSPLPPGRVDATPTSTLLPADWTGLWRDLHLGEAMRARLIALPLVAVLDGPHLGPLTTELLRGLDRTSPRAPTSEEVQLLDPKIITVVQYSLSPASLDEVIGGVQLMLGTEHPLDAGFAAWMRLLRTGVV